MDSLAKRVAFYVVIGVLALVLFPIIASAWTIMSGKLLGGEFPGSWLFALIANPGGPMSVIQKIMLPILGVVSLPVLWGERGRYALVLILCCALGIVAVQFVWQHLSTALAAADLWQEVEDSPLNGHTFPSAMNSYMTLVTILLCANLLSVFGLKGVEFVKAMLGGRDNGQH